MGNIKPHDGIMDIKPYKAGKSKLDNVTKIIKLSSNEGAFGPSPKAMKAYKEASENLHRYPDGSCDELRTTIAKTHNLDKEKIVCSAGSDELLGIICNAFAGAGTEVLYNEHGFLMYNIYAKISGATPVKAEETNLTVDIDKMLEAVTEKTKVVFLANPTNPTSTYIPTSEIRRLRENLRDDILLVVDEAYAEFVTKDDYSAGFELVEDFDNIIITRTFSKLYALGGIRLGWCYTCLEIAGILNRVRSPFNVSSAAQAAGKAALEDVEFVKKCVDHNSKWLDILKTEIPKIGFEMVDSVCNFILVNFPKSGELTADNADEFLKSKGIIARKVAAYNLPYSLRVTIGTDEEMNLLLDALREFKDNK